VDHILLFHCFFSFLLFCTPLCFVLELSFTSLHQIEKMISHSVKTTKFSVILWLDFVLLNSMPKTPWWLLRTRVTTCMNVGDREMSNQQWFLIVDNTKVLFVSFFLDSPIAWPRCVLVLHWQVFCVLSYMFWACNAH
jgi:hypothetical protein